MSTPTAEQFRPEPTPESGPFWDALRAGRLELPYCPAGEHFFFPPMPGCPDCGSDAVEYRPVSGAGRVYSWIVAHYAFDPEFAPDVPYTIVTVDLAEGPRIYGRWSGDPDALADGLAVRAVVLHRKDVPLLTFAATG
jgi:uncharacterized protein